MNDLELYHYGVKGQKWGVRRYQNSDGTLTDAGRKRYNNSESTIFENDQVSKFRVRTKNGLQSWVGTRTNISGKTVSANMSLGDKFDMTSKSSKEKMRKAQQFINSYNDDIVRSHISKKTPQIHKSELMLFSVDMDPDADLAIAAYLTHTIPAKVKIQMSTNTIID